MSLHHHTRASLRLTLIAPARKARTPQPRPHASPHIGAALTGLNRLEADQARPPPHAFATRQTGIDNGPLIAGNGFILVPQKALPVSQKLLRAGNELLPTEQKLLRTKNELLLTEQKLLRTENELLHAEQKLLRTENRSLRIELPGSQIIAIPCSMLPRASPSMWIGRPRPTTTSMQAPANEWRM